ncbi:hypothetical protein RCL1_001290 [Eukaryota sp. TZLM3-RCL]
MNDQHEITANAWELPSTEIVKRFGIQVDGRICFKNWSPGGEYSHKLVIKNASSNLMKISWKGCDSRLIVTRYPAPFTLPAGCHEIIELTFHPISAEHAVEDYIYLYTSQGSLRVLVEAPLPTLAFECTDRVDFGFAPTAVTTDLCFDIRNTGTVPLSFGLSSSVPFFVYPASGSISPHQKSLITVSFSPDKCLAVISNLALEVKALVPANVSYLSKSIEVTGISKLPFPFISNRIIDLGTNATNSIVSKRFFLANKSLVPMNFTINNSGESRKSLVDSLLKSTQKLDQSKSDRLSSTRSKNSTKTLINPINSHLESIILGNSGVFSLEPSQGIVPPNDSIPITIKGDFTGLSETDLIDRFYFQVPGLLEMHSFTVKAQIIPPSLKFSAEYLDFGDVIEQKSRILDLTVHNLSKSLSLSLQFFLSPTTNSVHNHGVFLFSQTRATIPKGLYHSFRIIFNPSVPGHYYRRVFVLIENMGEVKFIDIFGTCIPQAEAIPRPSPLTFDHILTYRLVHDLDQRHHLSNFELFSSRNAYKALELPFNSLPHAPSDDTDLNQAILPIGPENSNQEIRLSADVLDFRTVNINSKSVKILKLFNSTHVRYSLVWNICSNSNNFSIKPARADVSALDSVEFTVSFNPDAQNELFSCTFELFASPKAQRSFRLVSTPRPSTCLSVSCLGDTFALSRTVDNSALPNVEISPSRIVFGSTVAGQYLTKTLSIKNDGETDQYFNVNILSNFGYFEVLPKTGIVPARSFTLLKLRYFPKNILFPQDVHEIHHACKVYVCLTRLVADFSEQILSALPRPFCPILEFVGTVCIPSIKFSSNTLMFADTAIGTTGKQVVKICNLNFGLASKLQWVIPNNSPFSIDGSLETIISGNEEISAKILFKPIIEGNISDRISLIVSSITPLETISKTFILSVSGNAIQASVEFIPFDLNLGSLVLGKKHVTQLTIKNHSTAPINCNFSGYTKEIGHELSDLVSKSHSFQTPSEDGQLTSNVVICPSSGVVPACGVFTFDLEVTPRVLGVVEGVVKASLPGSFSENWMNFSFTGVLPSLKLIDVSTLRVPSVVSTGVSGVNHSLSRSSFAFPNSSGHIFNQILASNISPGEILFKESSGFLDGDSSKILSHLENIDVVFPTTLQGEADTIMEFCFQNIGVVPVTVNLLSKNSFKISVESWALETSHRGPEDLPLLPSTSSSDLSVEPEVDVVKLETTEFCLNPGDFYFLKVSACHDVAGKFSLRTVFSIQSGKTFVVSFNGLTLPKINCDLEPILPVQLPLTVTGCTPSTLVGHKPQAVEKLKKRSIITSSFDLGHVAVGTSGFYSLDFKNLSSFPVSVAVKNLPQSEMIDFSIYDLPKMVTINRNSSSAFSFKLFANSLGTFDCLLIFESNFCNFTLDFYIKIEFKVVDTRTLFYPLKPPSFVSLLPWSMPLVHINPSVFLAPTSIPVGLPPGSFTRNIVTLANPTSDIFYFKWRLDNLFMNINNPYSSTLPQVFSVFPSAGEIPPNSTVKCVVCTCVGNVSTALDVRCVVTNETLRQSLVQQYEILRKKWVNRDRNDDSTDEEDQKSDEEITDDVEKIEQSKGRKSVHLTPTIASLTKSKTGRGSVAAPVSITRSLTSKLGLTRHNESLLFEPQESFVNPLTAQSESELNRLKSMVLSQSVRISTGNAPTRGFGSKRKQKTNPTPTPLGARFLPPDYGSFPPEDAHNGILSFCSSDLFVSITVLPWPIFEGIVNQTSSLLLKPNYFVHPLPIEIANPTPSLIQITSVIIEELMGVVAQNIAQKGKTLEETNPRLPSTSSKQNSGEVINKLVEPVDLTVSYLGKLPEIDVEDEPCIGSFENSSDDVIKSLFKRRPLRRLVEDIVQNALRNVVLNL